MKKIIVVLGLIALIASASSALMRAGVETVVGAPFPYVGWQLNDSQAVDVGLTYASTNNGNLTNLGLGGKYTQKIMEVKQVKLNWFGMLGIASANAAGASTTTITLLGGLGAEYKLTDSVGVYGDVDLLTIQSMSGGATGTNFWLVTGDVNCYSGVRIYI